NSIDERIAIFEAGDDFISVHENNMPNGLMDKLTSGLILDAQLEGNKILKAELLEKETSDKQQEMKKRIGSLLKRNKK
ncbi:MAG: hypothetical protein J6A54_03895, partial [Clostridia bacterium]|nr:hypothetical protein [Clostridia bacterium]